MARIQKGFALSIAFLGVLSLIFGMGLAITSWVLTSKFKHVDIMVEDDNTGQPISGNIKHFSAYWWGGLFVSNSCFFSFSNDVYSQEISSPLIFLERAKQEEHQVLCVKSIIY